MLAVAFCAALLVALRTPSHSPSISCGLSSARSRISGHCVCTLETVCVGSHCSNGKRRRLRTPQTSNGTYVVHGYNPVKCPDCECKVPLRKKVAEVGSQKEADQVTRRKMHEKMRKDERLELKLFWQNESRGKRLKVPNVTQNISACVMVKDDNDKMVEWVAYHHYTLPLTRMVVCEEPGNQEYVRDRFANTEWENRIHFDFLVAGVDFYNNSNERACLKSSHNRNFSNTSVQRRNQFYRPIQRACFERCMKRLKSASGKCTLVHHSPI